MDGVRFWSRICRPRAEAAVAYGESRRAAKANRLNKTEEKRSFLSLKQMGERRCKKGDAMRKHSISFFGCVCLNVIAYAYLAAHSLNTETFSASWSWCFWKMPMTAASFGFSEVKMVS